MVELTDDILKKVIKKRSQISHKGDYGRVLVIGGNAQYGGAAILAASSAVHSGSGLVTVACDTRNHTALHAQLPEAMLLDFTQDFSKHIQAANVVLIGCGLGLEHQSLQLLKKTLSLIDDQQWLIIDGSAITLFAEENLTLKYPEKTVFTPHQMELERLTNIKISHQTLENIQEFSNKIGAILVAKSHETKIFSPNHENYILKIGTPAQATGGMGDTLAGMIAAFLGQFHEEALLSLAAASYLHSFIAQSLAQEQYVVLPSDIIREIPKFMKKFSEK
ncbi:NAD(P)H-hydrate dehydratase [Lactococcus nasutitermitis]|uniref:ADP-dependent (S)-NAD(P)H-hydrate dehydratase n=1 Tax=Lactococcus nasutitermitis TaxID=1652957 RepID=A0ABV9JFJ6_9LACT|nr:NAD(P)H-hydrate dehydratase [Lactococcus nasutitermitis]